MHVRSSRPPPAHPPSPPTPPASSLLQDTLWPRLTCAEHLSFYARIRGVPHRQLACEVAASLERVGMARYAHRCAADLSGGQRRRLSLAIALSGGPSILLCDEPTTGLDPASKRRVWRIIEAAKPGRVVVLVSHDLAEVEVLATRVGIMTHGRLRCLGDQQHLKLLYGGGYRLQLSYGTAAVGGALGAAALSDEQAAARAHALVTRLFPGAAQETHFAGSFSFVLPQRVAPTGAGGTRAGADAPLVPLRVSRVFSLMQAHAAAEGGVTDWALAQVSLDTVFQRIVSHYRGPGTLPASPSLCTGVASSDASDIGHAGEHA